HFGATVPKYDSIFLLRKPSSKVQVLTLPFVATVSLFTFVIQASSLDQLPQESGEAYFLIELPDVEFDQVDRSISVDIPEPRPSNKHAVTSVEIVKSVEVNLNDTLPEKSRIQDSGSTDLLFSDSDGKTKNKFNTGQNTRYRVVKYKRLKTSQEVNKSEQDNYIATDGLDFNGRILVTNILIRKTKDEDVGEDYDDKYSFYSEPKADSNKYHMTYINHNASAVANKSRVNIKFPPKVFPIKSPTVQRNKTIPYDQSPSKNQTQNILYRSRLGKFSLQSRFNKKENSTDPIIRTENKIDKGQPVTHWDFGKKTTNEPTDEGDDKAVNSADVHINPADITTNFPDFVHPTRSTVHPSIATTPRTDTENVVSKGTDQQELIQTPEPNQQSTFPVFNHISNFQGAPLVPSENKIKSPQEYQIFHSHNGNVVRQDQGIIHKPQGTKVEDKNIRNTNLQNFNTKSLQRTNVDRLHSEPQDLKNWQPVYFVPHIQFPQQQQQPASAVGLQAPQSIPIFLQQHNNHQQQQNSKPSDLVHPGLFPSSVVPRSTVPSQDELFYEGKNNILISLL
ncbi:hypothetical protein L9F63_006309, partial [Diploptera punctata]